MFAMFKNRQENLYPMSRDRTFAVLLAVAEAQGKVVDSDPKAGTLRFKMKAGIRPFRCKVKIVANEQGTLASLEGKSDDIWGHGAKIGIENYLDAVDAYIAQHAPAPIGAQGYATTTPQEFDGSVAGQSHLGASGQVAAPATEQKTRKQQRRTKKRMLWYAVQWIFFIGVIILIVSFIG
jgi:hypothetical protein